MTLKEESKFYKFKLLFIRARHGLLLMTLRHLLVRIGVDIGMYYWVIEGSEAILTPEIKGDTNDYEFGFLTEQDVESLKNISFINPNLLNKSNNNEIKLVGLKKSDTGKVAAFMFIEYKKFSYTKKDFKLKEGEVYLSNMYTYQDYRGKNLAPYLRYKSYELLKKEGIQRIYSITDYFNKSSQKFKRKLNAKNQSLYFDMILFKKFHKNFTIKKY